MHHEQTSDDMALRNASGVGGREETNAPATNFAWEHQNLTRTKPTLNPRQYECAWSYKVSSYVLLSNDINASLDICFASSLTEQGPDQKIPAAESLGKGKTKFNNVKYPHIGPVFGDNLLGVILLQHND